MLDTVTIIPSATANPMFLSKAFCKTHNEVHVSVLSQMELQLAAATVARVEFR